MTRKVVRFLVAWLRTVIILPYLCTLGLVHRSHRALFKEVTGLISARLFPAPSAPEITLADLVPDEITVTLCAQEKHEGNIGQNELLVICELVRVYQPHACFEIGSFDGRTTLNLAANAPEDAVIYTLDLPREQMGTTAFALDAGDLKVVDKTASGTRFHGTKWERTIRLLYGDSATFDYHPYVGKIDLVFIDGSHTYEYVLSDSRNAITLLRDGRGLILWHDYPGWPGVMRAVNELRVSDSRFANVRSIEGTSFAYLLCEG